MPAINHMTNEDERLISRKQAEMRESFELRLTPVRNAHPGFPGNTSPLPRPDHPQGTFNGWSGRGSGLVLPSYLRMQIAHQTSILS